MGLNNLPSAMSPCPKFNFLCTDLSPLQVAMLAQYFSTGKHGLEVLAVLLSSPT